MGRLFYWLTLPLLLLLASCAGSGGSALFPSAGDTLQLRHATHFQWIDYDGYAVARIYDPWKGDRLLRSFLLVSDQSKAPRTLPAGMERLALPLSRIYINSASHINLLHELGALPAVAVVCDLQYTQNRELRRRVEQGLVADAGNGMNPAMEQLVMSAPDALFVLPFENGGYGALEKLGVPIVECADYMEPSALAQAEWMRLYGRLVGQGSRADSLFAVVEENYMALRARVDTVAQRPRMMCETKMGSVWYVPGGASTMGRLYQDAGCSYLFADYEQSGSVPLSFEAVFARAAQADLWLMKYNAPQDKSYATLLAENELYARFAPFARRTVWACNTHRLPFYEETPFHPDRLLRDLILIFHPQLLPGESTRYYSKMSE